MDGMNALTKIGAAAEVHAWVSDGTAQSLREHHDGPRADVAQRLGVDAATLFRWEKGLSLPRGARLRMYHQYLKELLSAEVPA